MCIFSETECIIFEMPNYIIISNACVIFPKCKIDSFNTILAADLRSFSDFLSEQNNNDY